ncbi:hypothetical protein [Metasolibacillus sp.]|uniref:hypothetical protein n=1 Tax=Metasolibacillus sp. TaxID=2703680 RepID=UPI0025E449A2|nr:hypothetical protein [Metasolibacillus sp.]MCT6924082.1 hypothetical protein [Metasolibacillus sp.]MCT6940189.1 hypothetical protein [Metasolibacillus sp.]
MTKFIKIYLKSHEDYKIEEIKSVIEEEKGVRVQASEGELFIPYDNLLFYSISNEKEQVVAPVKYRSKSSASVVIEAFHYVVGSTVSEFQNFVGGNKGWFRGLYGELYIHTPEGIKCAQFSDYIIKNEEGELYLCKPDTFNAIYEKVGD